MTNVVGRISADVENGGWEADGLVWNDADALDFYQAVDVWFDLYVSGGWEGEMRPGFRGHLLPEAWTRGVQASEAPWKAFTAQEFMKQGEIQGIFFKSAASPANEHQITGMTFADIVEHIVGKSGQNGHCNLVAGLYEEGIIQLNIDKANSAAVATYEVRNGEFWGALRSIAQTEFYVLYVDKTNTLNYVPHPMFGTLPTPVFTLEDDWLLEPLRIERRNTEDLGQMILFAAQPDGTQITGTYPTDPNPGPIVRRGGYTLDSSADLDAIAQRAYLWETREYSVEAQIGNGVGLLVELLDRVYVTYSSAENGISWTDEPFWIHGIDVELLDGFGARTTLRLEQENTG